MSKGKVISEQEGSLIKQYRKEGKTYKEIGRLLGRPWSSIKGWMERNCDYKERLRGEKFSLEKWLNDQLPETLESTSQLEVEKKENKISLDSFSPREIIKYMYDLGYRIEDNKLVCYVKQTVNIKDIING